jgi:predicted amidohydrolase YtcJ
VRLLYNARIYTQDTALPSAQAIVMDGDRIVATGPNDTLAAQFPGAEKLDMAGCVIWPGLTDAHIHLEHYSAALQMVDCETATRAQCIQNVRERVQSAGGNGWIRGHGWNQNNWPEGFGSVRELDAVAPEQPVYLTAKSLHAAWANSAALRAAGVTGSTPDPEGGIIQRDEAGRPTGILLESAMNLVQNAIPAATVEETAQAIQRAQSQLWQYGITGVHDYDGNRCFEALQILQQKGDLHLRVIKGIPVDLLPHAASLGLRSGFGNDMLRIGAVKLFADGALGPRTAAMFVPYENNGENTGILLLDNEQIFEYGMQAAAHGMNLAIHAIGDRANHEVLVGYAHLRQYEAEHHLPHLRHRIEHVQILHPDDYGRLAALDVIASVQPIHATSDMYMADRHWGARSAGAYAFNTLLNQGTRYCFGSDAPVESPNPFLGIHAAVTRRRADGSPSADGWYPAQRLTLAEAVQGFTLGAAYAAGLENKLGKLAPGYFADLIVLHEDPFQIPPEELHHIQPAATMVGGEWVWQKAGNS